MYDGVVTKTGLLLPMGLGRFPLRTKGRSGTSRCSSRDASKDFLRVNLAGLPSANLVTSVHRKIPAESSRASSMSRVCKLSIERIVISALESETMEWLDVFIVTCCFLLHTVRNEKGNWKRALDSGIHWKIGTAPLQELCMLHWKLTDCFGVSILIQVEFMKSPLKYESFVCVCNANDSPTC